MTADRGARLERLRLPGRFYLDGSLMLNLAVPQPAYGAGLVAVAAVGVASDLGSG
ncbi:MAG: hypothetical protein WCA29_14505 [Jiangellales bacterium]